ncbi:MAG: RNA polymerase sigma factor [Rhizobiaceae bacterium]
MLAEQTARSGNMMGKPESDEHALAVLASNGDRAAFGQLVSHKYDFIFRTAWRWTRNRDQAEEVAQMVCLKLGNAIRQWKGEGAFSTWLYRMTINAATDLQRSERREARKMEGLALHMMVSGEWLSERQEGEADSDVSLWSAVNRLPDKQRMAVMLVHGDGLSHGEAAQIMEVAEGTVSYHLHAARKQLKPLIEEEREK